jgi:hypothetical protein
MGGIFNFVVRAGFFSFAAAARTGGALLALEAGAEAGEAAETLLRADFRADSEFFAFIAQTVRRRRVKPYNRPNMKEQQAGRK